MSLRQHYGWVLAPINGTGYYEGTFRLALGVIGPPPVVPLGAKWEPVYR